MFTLDKPVDTLVIRPQCGLGNRMCALFSAIMAVACGQYRSLVIVWDRDGHCDIDLEEVLTIKNIPCQIINSSQSDYNTPFNRIAINGEYHGIATVYFFPSRATNYGDYKSCIYSWAWHNLDRYVDWVMYDTCHHSKLGLHCRRSDYGATQGHTVIDDLSGQRKILDHQFLEYSSKYIDQFESAFLATDSVATQQHFIDVFGDKIKYHHKNRFPVDTIRTGLMRDSLIDLHNLSKAQLLLRDSVSTFSLLAHIIGRNYLITWRRPTMAGCGSGLFLHEQTKRHEFTIERNNSDLAL